MYRMRGEELEVFLVHPGGPFFRRRDEGAWSLPKGEFGPEEEPLGAAKREFEEEVGLRPAGPFLELGTIRQKGGPFLYGEKGAGLLQEKVYGRPRRNDFSFTSGYGGCEGESP